MVNTSASTLAAFFSDLRNLADLLSSVPAGRSLARSVKSITTIQIRPKGEGITWIGRMRTDKTKLIIKVHTAETRYVAKERRALQLCRQADASNRCFPEVLLAFDEGLPAFLVTTYIEGRPLSGCADVPLSILRSILMGIVPFRNIAFDTYGEIAGSYASIRNIDRLPPYTKQLVDVWLSRLAGHYELPDRIAAIAVCNDLQSKLAVHPCLCHGDLTPGNIIVRDGQVALVDFDNAFAYVPEFDLSRLYVYLLRQGCPIGLRRYCGLVADCYGSHTSDVADGMRQFVWVVLLRQISWCYLHDYRDDARALERLLEHVYDQLLSA